MEFRILGPLEAWDEGRELALGGPKPRRARRAPPPPQRGRFRRPADRRALGRGLARARGGRAAGQRLAAAEGAAGGRARTTRPPGYVVRVEPDALDLHRFERLVDEGRSLLARGLAADASQRLRDALSLWRGPALADFAYESFAQAAIAGSRRSGWLRSSCGSKPTSRSDATTSWWESSRPSSPSIRCASACGAIR